VAVLPEDGAAVTSLHISFFAVPKEREYAIANALAEGVKVHGDEIQIVNPAEVEGPDPWTDVAVFVGIKGHSRQIMEDHLAVEKHAIICDKGYVPGPSGPRSKYVRLSVDALQPLSYFQRTPRPDDRLKKLGIKLQPVRRGIHVIVAGGSLKYALFHGFASHDGKDAMTTWAEKTYSKVRKYTKRPVVYRPKPSWQDAVSIDGMRFSRPPVSIEEELRDAWCLITYGSNAAVDAVIAGVPVFILGDGIAKPLGLDDLTQLDDPYYPTDEERWQFLADVSYCQWSLPELASGEGWQYTREIIEGQI
jgi:hypothetical protein